MLRPTVLCRPATILVVDDEELLRAYLTRLLEDEGYHVVTAADGSEAWAVLDGAESPVGLVITDVVMPSMTGPELAARLAEQPASPPILFMSGSHTGTDLPGPLLAKPFESDDLTRLVHELIRIPVNASSD